MPAANPNHHLWRNGRLWWIAFTVIHDGWRQERVRRSLGTADLEHARRLRDELLLQYAAIPNAEVVALRSVARPARQVERGNPAATSPDPFDVGASLVACEDHASPLPYVQVAE